MRAFASREQAALRRVATLIAQNDMPEAVFEAAMEDAARLAGADVAAIGRYDADEALIAVASHGGSDALAAFMLGDLIRYGRRPVRAGASAGAPVIVDQRVWGAICVASTTGRALPADAADRLAPFAELLATAIANAERRDRLERLAGEQAALRRVATLVAHGAPPATLFAVVAEEVSRVVQVPRVAIVSYEEDGWAAERSNYAADGPLLPARGRWPLGGRNVVTQVHDTLRPARIDDCEQLTGAVAETVRALGIRSTVGIPIVVAGRLWGAMVVSSTGPEPLRASTEYRLTHFTELVATAIANAEGRAELIASRARAIAAGDEARERVARDLHDGAQQRLVHAVIALKLALREMTGEPGPAAALVNEALENAERANADLRELSHGILPSSLTRGGLRAGVDALVAHVRLPVTVDMSVERLPVGIEASVYFVVAEALTNIVKHARAQRAEIRIWVDRGALRLEVHDNGIGGARTDGDGLLGLADRVAALAGFVRVDSPPNGGTLIAVTLPLPV